MRAPVRPIRGRWPAWLERRLPRFFWADPAVMLDEHATPAQFREAMSAVHVGGTIKITKAGRHRLADALALDNLDLSSATIVDIGASDGSTAVDLVAKLPGFGAYILADLYFHLSARCVGPRVVVFDPSGQALLIAGRRLVAWPSLSAWVRRLYAPVLRRAVRQAGDARPILLLNPTARALIESDERVTFREHDVFRPWPGPPPDLIKVANLLRLLYFSSEQIRDALLALLESLPEGGHLLLVDNPRITGIDERAGLYRREQGRFVLVAQTDHAAEVDGLVHSVALDAATRR